MLNFGGFSLHGYGLIIGLAIVVAWEISLFLARKRKVDINFIEGCLLWAVIGGILGARIYHVIDKWPAYYSLYPIKVIFLWEGGLGIWGAVIGGAAALIANYKYQISKQKNKVSLLEVVDIAALGIPIAQAIGRLGNWINGELMGKNGEPLFAIEATFNLFLFGVLWKFSHKNKEGRLTAIYLVGYGIIRVLLENLREEESIWRWNDIAVAQIMGIMAIAIGGFILLKYQKQS